MSSWFRSIRVRLTATIALALALVLTLVAAITTVLVRDTLYRRTDEELIRRVRLISFRLERNPNAAAVGRLFVESIADPEHPTYLQILTRDRAVLFAAPGVHAPHLPESETPMFGMMDNGQLRWYSTETPLYFLSVALPVGDIEESLRVLRLTFGIAVPVALLAALFLAYTIARRSLAPVDRITATAHRITSQSLRQRIPVTNTDDELGRLITTLNEMIARLEGSFTSITQFTTNAAHEMRTPLTILRGELELALRDRSLPAAQRQLLESNCEEVNRLIGIVEDLFTLARADSNALSLSYEMVELDELLLRLQPKMDALAAPRSIRVTMSTEPDCVVVGDSNRLTQVAINLVDNAVKYSPNGSDVAVSLVRRGANAELRVADAGIGIDPAHQARIFERFFRVDDARTRDAGGTGLGLAIVKSIVAAHRGTVAVESTAGTGSTFIVTLPIAQID